MKREEKEGQFGQIGHTVEREGSLATRHARGLSSRFVLLSGSELFLRLFWGKDLFLNDFFQLHHLFLLI